MNLPRFIVTATALFACCTYSVARVPDTGPQTAFTVPHVEGQLVIGLAPGVDADAVVALLGGFGAVLLDEHEPGRLALIGVASDSVIETASTLAVADPRVEFAEPNYLFATDATPNDFDFAQQWAKDNNGVNAPMGLGTPGADLNLVEAWDTRSTAPGVVIAVIDDSVDTTHLDLAGNVSANGKCFASPNSSRPCANGPDDPNPTDNNDFHGTLVAGTAGARGNNGIGIAGTAWEVTLLPLKVDLSTFAIAQAIDEAVAQGADIINMSFGGPAQSAAQSAALDRAETAGILAVASAGNADASNDNALHYPSDSTQPNVLSIAATNSQDRVSSFSQWGSIEVDLAAPGELTRTTANGNSYASVSGTSFSAPHVAGVAALVKAETAAPDYEQVKAHLLFGGIDGVAAIGPVVPGQDKRAVPGRVTTGRLDAARALTGPTGGVVVVSGIAVDDTLSGNNNGRLDPGETASLVIMLRNHWTSEPGVTGTLSTPDNGLLAVNDVTPVLFGTIGQGATATARFSVTLAPGLTGNEQIFLQLDLASTGPSSLPSRYFYVESGSLQNGQVTTEQIQRWNWDEFHAYHVDVPAGSDNLVVTTSGPGDVDLLLRYADPPDYLITLDAEQRGLDGFYYVDRDTEISGNPGSNESIAIANPLPGTYHIVVVNYDRVSKTYDLTASFNSAGTDTISFSDVAYSANEDETNAIISVTRSGGPGSASVGYQTSPGTASPGTDYLDTSGTLSWAPGESGTKTFEVALIDDAAIEANETVMLQLVNAAGSLLGTPSTAELSIQDDDGNVQQLEFTQSAVAIDESTPTITLTVSRTRGTDGTVSVDFETRGLNAVAGDDFQSASGTLNWTDGDAAAKSIEITIVDDSIEESSENFSVVLLRPSGASTGSPDRVTVTISDDDSSSPLPPTPSGGSGGSGALGALSIFGLLLLRRRRISGRRAARGNAQNGIAQ